MNQSSEKDSQQPISDDAQPDSAPQNSIPTPPREGRLAGIDFGTVRIGIAICDSLQIISSPHETYNRRNLDLDAKYFLALVADEKVAGFVVGLPVHMSGDESQKSREAVAFGKWLFELTSLPVDWIDERYTSAAARQMLAGSGLSGKKRKERLDKLAAQVILSTYLESGSRGQTAEALG